MPENSHAPSVRSGSAAAAGRRGKEELELIPRGGPLEDKYKCPVCTKMLSFPVQFEECNHASAPPVCPKSAQGRNYYTQFDDSVRLRSRYIVPVLMIVPAPSVTVALTKRLLVPQTPVIDRAKVYCRKPFQKYIKPGERRHGNSLPDDNASRVPVARQYKDLQAHHDECKFNMVECRLKCGVTLEGRYLKKHMEKECPRRIIACDFCADKMEYEEELEHLNTCPKLPVTCPNGCQTKNIARADLTRHVEEDCVNAGVPCKFHSFGCAFNGKRLEMRKHEEKELQQHVGLLCGGLVSANTAAAAASKVTYDMQRQVTNIDAEFTCDIDDF
ncbi:PREDICTED: TNF receptor-associated factor 6-B-like [Priapulus caudatus]|uniref:TNF receptor-associated factor 6-B-like n=1 Tax=Priapulus caudatus TaxID=37621 RepID=A0ABM1E492_PRICU|nr:PREDICTED: TNF receptor-associated factor 6-B-like [Priapulus caudatus]